MTTLYTIKEVARYLKVSSRTVHRMIHSGELKALRVGKQWRISAANLPGAGLEAIFARAVLEPTVKIVADDYNEERLDAAVAALAAVLRGKPQAA